MKPATWKLALLHLAGTALPLWGGYYWLGVGESSAGALVWSAFVALACILAAIWLHGVALAQFQGSTSPLKTSLRNLPALAVAAGGAAGIYVLLSQWQAYNPKLAFPVASYLTLTLRKPVKPASVLRALDGVFWILRWWLVPLMALPLAAGVASGGWKGFATRFWPRRKQWMYWPAVPALLVCALWVPRKLVLWVPQVTGFRVQFASFAARFLAAYLLLVGALLLLDYLSVRASAQAGRVDWRGSAAGKTTSPPPADPGPAN